MPATRSLARRRPRPTVVLTKGPGFVRTRQDRCSSDGGERRGGARLPQIVVVVRRFALPIIALLHRAAREQADPNRRILSPSCHSTCVAGRLLHLAAIEPSRCAVTSSYHQAWEDTSSSLMRALLPQASHVCCCSCYSNEKRVRTSLFPLTLTPGTAHSCRHHQFSFRLLSTLPRSGSV